MHARPITTFLLDSHDIVRIGVRTVLDAAPGIEVAGEASGVRTATEAVLQVRPDVLVLEPDLGEEDGLQVLHAVREALPDLRTMVLTARDDDATLAAAIAAGATGFLGKRVRGEVLLETLRRVASGENAIDPTRAVALLHRRRAHAFDAERLSGLTEQERRILPLIAEGLTNREIGTRLFLAEKTVRNHVTRILAKLGVQSRTQAALLAHRHG